VVELAYPAGLPDIRKEAITSRPLLLSAVSRSAKHAGQTQIYPTPMHAAQQKMEQKGQMEHNVLL
jgi:hypothetical protein